MNSSIFIESDKGAEIILATDLLYITIDANKEHNLCFVTKKEKYYSKGDLNSFENSRFTWLFRCHRSFIVNLLTIREVNKYERLIYFLNDESNNSCPFSRRKHLPLLDSLKKLSLMERVTK